MFLRQHAGDNGPVFIKFGLGFLVVANVANYFLHRGNAVAESVSDPLAGFLFGLSFGCLGLGIWARRRRRWS